MIRETCSLLSDYMVKWRTPPSFSCSNCKKNREEKKSCPCPILIILVAFGDSCTSCINLQLHPFIFLLRFSDHRKGQLRKKPWFELPNIFYIYFWKSFTVTFLRLFFQFGIIFVWSSPIRPYYAAMWNCHKIGCLYGNFTSW